MKNSKLLFLGMLIVALAVPAMALQSPADCGSNDFVLNISKNVTFAYDENNALGPTTITYTISTGNPNSSGIGCDVTSLDVTFTAPDGTPTVLETGGSYPIGTATSVLGTVNYTVDSADVVGGVATAFVTAEGILNDIPGPTNDPLTVTKTVSVLVINPEISITKSAEPVAICEGDTDVPVTYTYHVSWGPEGDSDMTDVVVADDMCGPVTRQADDPGNNDAWLEFGEVWVYTCDTTVSGETTNTATANANDLNGNPVPEAEDSYTITVNPPPVVSVDPDAVEICEVIGEVQLCAQIEDLTGTPPFTYEWVEIGAPSTVLGTESCLTVSATGEYCVTVTDAAGCKDTACGLVTIIPQPDCSIEGPTSICEEDIGNPQTYCTPVVADHIEWEVMSGPGTIPGDYESACVDVVPTDLGTIVLELRVWNDVAPDGSCGNSCQITILVEECGGGFCTFTQGFYGNVGGMACGGMTTTEIINAVLGDGVVAGIQGQRSITFTSAADIILRLPCGGKPRALPEGLNVNASNTAALKTAKLLKGKDDRITNTLVGQVVALTLNMRLHTIPCMDADGFDQPLGDYVFPEAEYICVQKGEDGCIMRYEIPESLQGLSVAGLLEVANMALAGDEELVDGAYAGSSFVNELFDECLTIVNCPVDPVEICDDGCDNDFDGYTDLDDPDCQL
jgi:hypothetical protein